MRQILKLTQMSNTQLTPEQYELFKNAETYLKQKRLLYIHFFVFVLGCVFFFVANKILDYGVQYNWYLWLSLIWLDRFDNLVLSKDVMAFFASAILPFKPSNPFFSSDILLSPFTARPILIPTCALSISFL